MSTIPGGNFLGGDSTGSALGRVGSGVLERLKKSTLLRTTLTSLFVLFMLAAAHLFMVAINAAEMAVVAPTPAQGEVARNFSDRPLTEEIERALVRAKTPQAAAVLASALTAARNGEEVALRTLPVTPFLVWTALGLSALGMLLIWSTSLFKSDAAQSIIGIFGGNLLWTGGVEYGLIFAARSLGIGRRSASWTGSSPPSTASTCCSSTPGARCSW